MLIGVRFACSCLSLVTIYIELGCCVGGCDFFGCAGVNCFVHIGGKEDSRNSPLALERLALAVATLSY